MLEFKFDEYPAQFKKCFLFECAFIYYFLELLFDLLTEFIALGQFTSVVIAACQVGIDNYLPEFVYILQNILS